METRQRIGFGFVPNDAGSALDLILRAENAGIETVWTVMPALGRDTLTLSAAAAVLTDRVKLGTAIVPAFTRHPLALATQVLTLEDLAPGRLRLGIGTSHQRTMIPAYGLPFAQPLAQLREYIQVLRPALQQGAVTFSGKFYRAEARLAYASGTPLLISALREHAFELAGELTDGAISWLCPVEYLVETAQPALARGAKTADRDTPPLVAHVLLCPRTDRAAVTSAARQMLGYYASAVFYQRMFAAAGFPLGPDNAIPDALVDALVLSGDDQAIADGLRRRLDLGLDELLISLVPTDDPVADQNALFRIVATL